MPVRRLAQPYRTLLALPGSRHLLVSSIVARLPAGMTPLALLLLVRDATGSYATAGLAIGAEALAGAVVAPVLGMLVDRIGPRPTLLPTAAGRAALLMALVLAAAQDGGAALLIALAAAAGAVRPPVAACARAAWPMVARTPVARDAAYAVDATTQEVIWTSGPLLVGAMIAFASPAAAVVLAAAVTLGGTASFATAPVLADWPRGGRFSRGGVLPRDTMLRALLVCGGLVGLNIGALEVGLPALAMEEGSRDASGLLLAAWSVGSLVGGLLYGALGSGTAGDARLPQLLAALSLCTTPLIVVGSLPAAVPLSALAGLMQAPVFTCLNSLIGRLAPTGAVATAFTWSMAALVAGIAAGSAVGGVLVERTGVDAAFALGFASVALAVPLVLLARGAAVRRG